MDYIIYIFTPAVGMIGNLLMPGLASPDTVFPEMLLKYTPIVFAALVISGALAASMSTGDSQLHAVSTMVSTDVYKTYVNKEATEYQQYKVARLGTLIFGFLSVIVALMRPGLISDILALANGGVLNDHHGVGLKLSRLVREQYGPALQVLQALKKGLDPNGIMNPYKMGL